MYFCPWPENLHYYKSTHDDVRNFLCHLFHKIVETSRFQKLNVILAEFDASHMWTIQSYNLSVNYNAYCHVNSKPPLSLDIILLFINEWSVEQIILAIWIFHSNNHAECEMTQEFHYLTWCQAFVFDVYGFNSFNVVLCCFNS